MCSQIKGNLQQAVFQKEVYKNASAFDWQNFKDDDLRRQFLFATQIGTDILPDKDLARVRTRYTATLYW